MLTRKQVLNLMRNTSKIPYLVGQRGEGKTTFVREIASSENLKLNILNLSCVESGDFQGLPYIENGNTRYARPYFLDCDLLFLDEIDRVRDDSIKSALLSLFQDRKINGHEFKGLIISAGNGNEGNYDTVDFDDALKDRLSFIKFEYSIDQKLKFLRDNYPKNKLLDYIEARTEIFSLFSTRTIEQSLRVFDDIELVACVLSRDVSRHYEQYLASNLVTLSDLLEGESTDLLTSLARISLANEIANNLKMLAEKTTEKLSHVNRFINELKAEEKAVYFTKIKSMLENDSINKDDLNTLNSLSFFKGQKEYLKELV